MSNFAGRSENISTGGIGLLCDCLLTPDTVVRCAIALREQAAQIPTLLKVRWVDHRDGKKPYRMGLQFLL